jgi:hypothetical protein
MPETVDRHADPFSVVAINLSTSLESGIDLATISLWLGHENIRSSQAYLHAHMALKEKALARTTPAHTTAGRYRPPDTLLAFLEQL